jgi:hypothetical protein
VRRLAGGAARYNPQRTKRTFMTPSVLSARLAFARAMAAAVAVVLAVGGIPGDGLRPIVFDAALAPPPGDSPKRDGAVEVTVRAGGDVGRPPIAGAHVRALSILEDRAYLADARETDRAGRALLARLPRGATWIVAEAPGRARGSTRLVVDSERREIAMDLDPEHTIDVVVKDETGEPIGGAEVEVLAPGDPIPIGARSGRDGVAHVTRLGAGPWRMTARAPGFEEAGARAAHEGDNVTIVLRKLGSLLVHVVGEGDASVAGARVSVAGATLWPARSAETDVRGDVRIGGLAAGIYALRASRGDLVSAIELGVSLGRGEDKSIDLKVGPGRWVVARVTDGDSDDAAGIAAARVMLAEGGLSPFPLEATTDAKGRARLGPIAAGAATVSARADGFVPRGAVLLADPLPPETRIALVRAGVMTGRVVDDRGYPVGGASIAIVGTDPGGAPIFDDPRRASFQAAHFDAMLGGPTALVPAGELGVMPGPVPAIPPSGAFLDRAILRGSLDVEPWVTRGDGTFRASPASPGRLRAVVHHPQFVEAQSDPVTLAPGGEANVEIVMHGGGALEGRVVDARDRPVEGARILVSATRGVQERTARTAADGTFAFAALPDTVTVTASTQDDDQPDVRVSIAIPERGRKEVTIRLPEPRGPLPVTVVDDHDWPIAAAQVSAVSLSADSPLRATAFTDGHGDAQLKRARGLPLRVEASAPGHAPHVVTTDGNGDALRMELAPAETATGEVVAARGGYPVEGADVTLYTDLGVRRARTDRRGAFALGELAPGGGRLHVRAPGFASVSRPVVVPDSAGRRPFLVPRLELAAGRVIEGEVVDARGEPVAGARVALDHAPTWLLVGAVAEGVSVTDPRGRFSLGELPEGSVAIEAYAPDVGRGRVEGVKVTAARTSARVRIVLAPRADETRSRAAEASGSVAVTLGESSAPPQVVVVSVTAGSEAERAGLAPDDVVLSVDGAPVGTIEEAREKLGGPLSDDVVVRVQRGDRELAVRVAREAVR